MMFFWTFGVLLQISYINLLPKLTDIIHSIDELKRTHADNSAHTHRSKYIN